ncbi:proline and serine-rich protein 2 isoform X2 [Bombina bombina]|uniref:proline and serine-rich protein 2 isoform X2 n=1 Tax=Bombina bombina TaxID=8345 RepID=UPI00235A7847|nr:proline and serine-rich protein 2 isoform X2 [Bombina bombina]
MRQLNPSVMLQLARKDDENLKYLTNEEKNALLFFEETLDAFEDDIEEPQISSDTSFGFCSPKSAEESQSESEDIIDLVQLDKSQVDEYVLPDLVIGSEIGRKTTQTETESVYSTSLTMVLPEDDYTKPTSELPSESRKFLGAVPTPVIIAQKISEKKAENANLSPLSPKEGNSGELKRSVATSPISEDYFRFPGRFPNNINIKQVGKQYNKTIAKAAVNVQERKAQVLANLTGPALYADEMDNKGHREQLSRSRSSSFRDMSTEQTRYEALTKLGLVKETPAQTKAVGETSPITNGHHPPNFLSPESPRKYSNEPESISSLLKHEPSQFVPLGKTVVFKGDEVCAAEKSKRHSAPQSIQEQKQPNLHQDIKRTFSMPRPTGFRPQGITVQFSGRDASEESKKDALRRLGLLKKSF